MTRLRPAIDAPVIKIITGIRRCGKSSVLRLIQQELLTRAVAPDNIILMDFESLSQVAYREYMELYQHVCRKVEGLTGKVYLLFDEIQEVKEWERAVRSFTVDFDCDVFLTGSNANLLSKELATHLAGRYVEYELFPLSFREYLDFHEVRKGKPEVEDAFYQYLKDGGFPGLFQLPADEDLRYQYIKGIYNTVVLKDVIQRNSIRDTELLERVFLYIMENMGQIFSAGRIADYLRSQGRSVGIESIYGYIQALESGLVIYAAKRYDIKKKKVLDRMEKYFLTDVGLRHALLGYREADIAQLLANIVYLELKRFGYQVFVGKENDREVDFVAMKKDEKKYFQVAYLLATPETIEREYAPLMDVPDHYEKYVLSMDKAGPGNRNGVKWMNLVTFLCTWSG